MKFYELIRKCDPETIIKTLIKNYPDQEGFEEEYYKVLEKLKYMQPISSDPKMTIVIEQDDYAVDVSGIQDGSNESWAIEFKPWEKWLDYDMHLPTLAIFTPEECIAHCLSEMTALGFEQDEIQEKFQELEDAIEDIENGNFKGKRFKSVREMLNDILSDDESD